MVGVQPNLSHKVNKLHSCSFVLVDDGHVRCYQCKQLYEFPLTLCLSCRSVAVQARQLGMQQGMEQALQQGQGQGASGELNQTAQQAQERVVLEQMQKLGLLTDASGNMDPGKSQGAMYMLNKQGTCQHNYACCCNISCNFA